MSVGDNLSRTFRLMLLWALVNVPLTIYIIFGWDFLEKALGVFFPILQGYVRVAYLLQYPLLLIDVRFAESIRDFFLFNVESGIALFLAFHLLGSIFYSYLMLTTLEYIFRFVKELNLNTAHQKTLLTS